MGPTRQNDCIPVYKLVVIGNSAVGKTSLIHQFLMKTFIPDYHPSTDDAFHVFHDNYIQNTEIDGKLCKLDVLEASPNEEYPEMREHYMLKADGFLLVYSVTDKSSLENIMKICTQIIHVKGGDSSPMLLVANKVDLVHRRKVSEKEGRDQCQKFNIPYIETSASNHLIVDAAFHKIVHIINDSRSNDLYRNKKQGYFKKCVIA